MSAGMLFPQFASDHVAPQLQRAPRPALPQDGAAALPLPPAFTPLPGGQR